MILNQSHESQILNIVYNQKGKITIKKNFKRIVLPNNNLPYSKNLRDGCWEIVRSPQEKGKEESRQRRS